MDDGTASLFGEGSAGYHELFDVSRTLILRPSPFCNKEHDEKVNSIILSGEIDSLPFHLAIDLSAKHASSRNRLYPALRRYGMKPTV